MTSCHREWLDRFCHRDMTWTNPSGSCLFSLPRLLCCSRYVKVPVNADYDAVSTSSSQKSSNSSLGLRGQSLSAVCLSMTAVVVLPVVCHRPTHHITVFFPTWDGKWVPFAIVRWRSVGVMGEWLIPHVDKCVNLCDHVSTYHTVQTEHKALYKCPHYFLLNYIK